MAPDPSSNMAEQSEKATGFFSLPRELRDRIYEMVREDHRIKNRCVVFEFRAAIPEKRLVSREFKSEYDQRSAVNTFVRMFDLWNMCTFKQFPRLAIKSCYLELAWTTEDHVDDIDTLIDVGPIVPNEFCLRGRMESLRRLVGHLPEIEDVHVELVVYDAQNINKIISELIACPVLTSFSIKSAGFTHDERSASGGSGTGTLKYVTWSCAKETVNFAIWSRKHGFLVDNTDEKKAEQEVATAYERYLRREAAEKKIREAESRESDKLGSSNGSGENSRDDSAGEGRS